MLLNKKNILPELITDKERVDFLKMCGQGIPSFSTLESRINQKMYPNLKEMLFSMRECEEDDDEE